MAEPGAQPQLAWLPVDKLTVDERYQRALDTSRSKKHVARIAANFRWINFQAILAVPHPETGGWRIIDGQHRVAAARLAGEMLVPAVIVPAADLAAQAKAFVAANRERITVSAQAIYYAELLAGDAQATLIARLAKDAGITILRYAIGSRLLKPGQTTAVPIFRQMLSRFGEETTARAIKIVAAAWGQKPGALRAPFFAAVAMVIHDHIPPLPNLAEILGAHEFAEMEKAGLLRGGAWGPARQMIDVIRRWIMEQEAPLKPVPHPAAPPTAPLKVGTLPAARFTDSPAAVRDRGSGPRGQAEILAERGIQVRVVAR